MTTRPPSTLAARRDVRPLPFLKTSFDDTLLQVNSPNLPAASKSTPNLRSPTTPKDAPRTSTSNSSRAPSIKSVKKSLKKPTLLHLFNKPQVERAGGLDESGITRPDPSKRHAPNFSRPSISARQSLYTQPPLSREQSASDLRKVPTDESDQARTPKASALAANPTPALYNHDPTPRATPPVTPLSAHWTPPPLLQAFPQAVLHGDLEDPDYHTLRLSRPKRKGHNWSGSGEGHYSRLKTSKHALRRPSIPHSISSARGDDTEEADPALGRKTYVLATSGHILQYSGSGPPDRQPEKTLKLGPKSVAFASDAIPGKHWVIQVLQTASDDEANPFANEKSFFSRFMLTTKLRRKAVRSMLLVVESPTEMNRWLVSIRREILKFCDKPRRPQTPSQRSSFNFDDNKPPPGPPRILTLPRAASPSNLYNPSSPTKHHGYGLSVPTSPTDLDSGYISSGTTLAGDLSSSRSSRQPVHASSNSDHHKVFGISPHPALGLDHVHAISDDYDEDSSATSGQQQPSNTAGPPMTPGHTNVNVSLADSPNQSLGSPERRRGSLKSLKSVKSGHTHKDSADQQFFTPASTPMLFSFRQAETAKGSSQNSASTSPVRRRSLAPTGNKTPPASSDSNLGYAINQTPPLKPSECNNSLYTFNEANESNTTKRSTYFGARSPAASSEDVPKLPTRSPNSNAFAQRDPQTEAPASSVGMYVSTAVRRLSHHPSQLHSVSESALSDAKSKRTSFRGNSPRPLHTASSATPAKSGEQRSLHLRDSVFADLGLGIQSFSGAFGSSPNRKSTLGQLSGQKDVSTEQTTTKTLPAPESGAPGHSPTIPPPIERGTLRRPSNIHVNTDVAPFLSASRRSSAQGTTPASAPAGTPSSRLPTPSSATRGAQGRNSVLVPVVRPPIRGGQRMSRQGRIGGPPMSNPPAAPLPPTPPRDVAPGVAKATAIASH